MAEQNESGRSGQFLGLPDKQPYIDGLEACFDCRSIEVCKRD